MNGIDAPRSLKNGFRMSFGPVCAGPLMFKANPLMYVTGDNSLEGKRLLLVSPRDKQRTGIRKERFRRYV